MKISANREDLLRPLLQVGSVVERRQTLPILANVLLRCHKDRLELIATDLEVELRTYASAESTEEHEFTLPARKLTDICKALPEGAKLELSIEGDKATIRSGRARFTLGVLPAVDYPSIDPASATTMLSASEGVLKRLIEKTQFAMAQQDVRYYLNGLLLEVKNGRVRAVATDGHRMAMCEAKLGNQDAGEIAVILPRKAVIELSRLLGNGDDAVGIEISNSHVRVRIGESSFTSKLIDGRFPEYEKVIPTGKTEIMIGQRETLRSAMARTAILSNEKYRGIRFKLTSDSLQLQAHNPEQDVAEEEVMVDYGGPDIAIGFNVGYLLDVLAVLDEDEVSFALIDSNSSALVTGKGSDECRYVVMPMRL